MKKKDLSKHCVEGKTFDGEKILLQESYPKQLSFFQYILLEDKEYSNTIELYDAIPKYYPSPKKMASLRTGGSYLKVLERTFKHRGEEYSLELTPARIKKEDSTEVEYYPTIREHIIEEALRKLAIDPQCGRYFDGKMGVRFTLYQLQNELKRMKHSIKYPSLIEALKIANKTSIIVSKKANNKSVSVSSTLFPILTLSTRDDWVINPKSTYCYVQFHPLVTQSIQSLSYRQFDYNIYMSFKKLLSRWLHRRICHNYTQAKFTNFYSIKTSTIVRDSGLISNEYPIRKQIKEVEDALEEMKEKGIVYSYKTNKEFIGRNIIEAIHDIYPSLNFVNDTVSANKKQRYIADTARNEGFK